MSSRRPSAVVIGSGIVSLGVINDLVADGVSVAHISPKPDDLALRSRWPLEKLVMDPSTDPASQLLALLRQKSDAWKGACLLPTTDPLLRVVSKNLDAIRSHYVTPVVDWERLNPVVNKGLLYGRAERAGVPTPRILYGDMLETAPEWAESVQYPVIVKPSQTPEFFAVFNAKVLEADNADELRGHLATVARHGLDVMVSEVVPGPQENLKAYRCYIDQQGRVVAEMCSEKVRGHPPEFGVGIVQRTIPPDDTLCRQGRTLLQALDFRGFATTEFKLDERDGQFKLMEINPRPAMVQLMFRKAGLNFAKLTVDDLIGESLRESYDYQAGVYCIHNSADIYHFKRFAKQGLSGLREYFRPYLARRKALLLPPLRDPRPFLYDMRRVFGGYVRRHYRPATVQ